MNCRKVSHLLSAYMDGELSGVEHRLILQHLARCPECQDEYQSLLQMKHLLAGMRIQEPRHALPPLILQEIAEEEFRAAERSPAAWLRKLQRNTGKPLAYTQIIGVGVSLALVGFLVSTRVALSSSGASPSGITLMPADVSRDAPPPPADELTRGLVPSGTERFVGQPVSHYSSPWPRTVRRASLPVLPDRSAFSRPFASPEYQPVSWPVSH